MSLSSDLKQLKAAYAHNPDAIQAIRDTIALIETHITQLLTPPRRAKRAGRGDSPDPSPATISIPNFAPEISF